MRGGTVRFPDIERALDAAGFDAKFLERFTPRQRLPNAARMTAVAGA